MYFITKKLTNIQDGEELINVSQKYKVTNGKLTRSNPFCPHCSKGVFMRDAGDWRACGKCGDRLAKEEVRIN